MEKGVEVMWAAGARRPRSGKVRSGQVLAGERMDSAKIKDNGSSLPARVCVFACGVRGTRVCER